MLGVDLKRYLTWLGRWIESIYCKEGQGLLANSCKCKLNAFLRYSKASSSGIRPTSIKLFKKSVTCHCLRRRLLLLLLLLLSQPLLHNHRRHLRSSVVGGAALEKRKAATADGLNSFIPDPQGFSVYETIHSLHAVVISLTQRVHLACWRVCAVIALPPPSPCCPLPNTKQITVQHATPPAPPFHAPAVPMEAVQPSTAPHHEFRLLVYPQTNNTPADQLLSPALVDVKTAIICRWFDFMSCSVRSLVMPHSAISNARGDDMITTISWNSGV